MNEENLIRQVVNEVVKKIVLEPTGNTGTSADPMAIAVNASNRHVHLSRADADLLFGAGYTFKHMKDLSQPGQFAEQETLIISGPKGAIPKVRILGPCRSKTQVEILASDQYALGIQAPVRQSGDLKGAASLTIIGPQGSIHVPECAIIAQRHIHLDPPTAEKMRLRDQQTVSVEINSPRPITFRDVLVRVHPEYAPDMHVDIDEANACLIPNGTAGIIKP